MGVKVTMSAVSTKSNVQVGSANLDWTNLNYEFRPTNSFLKLVYRAGKWENMELKKDPYVSIHVGATALHYGQSCFEGMKAFHCKDGYIRVFRPNENAKRFARSCHRICMPTVPEDLFLQAINTVVADNIAYIPPYGSGHSHIIIFQTSCHILVFNRWIVVRSTSHVW
jgi:branched-chain amino acid aminotransferase